MMSLAEMEEYGFLLIRNKLSIFVTLVPQRSLGVIARSETDRAFYSEV